MLVEPARRVEAQAVKPVRGPHPLRQPRRIADEQPEADRPVFLLKERRLVRDRQQVLERGGLGQVAVARVAGPRIVERRELLPARAREGREPTGVRVGHALSLRREEEPRGGSSRGPGLPGARAHPGPRLSLRGGML